MTLDAAARIIIVAVLALATIWASGRILGRLGFSPWWSVISWLMPVNIIGLIVLSLIEWPIERDRRR